MEKPLVNRSEYHRLRQAALLPFTQHLLERILDQPDYAAVQAPAQALQEKRAAYSLALSLAETRGRDVIKAKEEAKKALFGALDRLVDALEQQAGGSPLYLTNTGLSLRQTGRRRFTGPLGTPEPVRIVPAKNSGEALVEFGRVEGARMYAVEWSAGDDPSWQNGSYSSARRIVIPVTARRDIRVRVCALGAANRRSSWSVPVQAFIP